MHRANKIAVIGLILGMVSLVSGTISVPVVAAADSIPDVAPNTPTAVYFPQTGHALSGAFLRYWKDNGGLTRLGFPVTEEMSIKDNTGKMITVQFLERVRMEYHPENAGTPYEVLLGQLGRELAGNRSDQPFAPVPESTRTTFDDDRAVFFPETKHTIANSFRLYWQANGGLPIYGYPLSQEFSERNADDGKTYAVQYFERARFEWHPEIKGGTVLIGLMGKASAQTINANTTARPQGTLIAWSPNFGEKWIEVDVSNQRLNAKIGDATVWTTLVSTGIAKYPTPPGDYRTYAKLAKDDMTNGKAAGADYYYLPDVPWVMYFLAGGYAIHGTYWHSNFGTPMSHGCVNVSIDGAKLLFDWAPVDTRVVVHD